MLLYILLHTGQFSFWEASLWGRCPLESNWRQLSLFRRFFCWRCPCPTSALLPLQYPRWESTKLMCFSQMWQEEMEHAIMQPSAKHQLTCAMRLSRKFFHVCYVFFIFKLRILPWHLSTLQALHKTNKYIKHDPLYIQSRVTLLFCSPPGQVEGELTESTDPSSIQFWPCHLLAPWLNLYH